MSKASGKDTGGARKGEALVSQKRADPRSRAPRTEHGDADLVFIGRALLRDPYWAIKTQQALGDEPSWPVPYGYAVKRRAK